MKSPDEIKKGLECCVQGNVCRKNCPYGNSLHGIVECTTKLSRDALAYIQQLEAEANKYEEGNDALIKIVKRLEAERDAAVECLRGRCDVCRWQETAKCASCRHDVDAWNAHDDNWEWRGVQKEE